MQATRQKGKKKRYEERQRRRKAAGERFIGEDGISRRGRWRAKEEMERGDRAEVDLGREGGEEMEKAHPLSADCCSLVVHSHHQINNVRTPVLLIPTLPQRAAYFILFLLTCSLQPIQLLILDITNTETQTVVIPMRHRCEG